MENYRHLLTSLQNGLEHVDFKLLNDVITSLSLVLIGIIITVFVLIVTLLGRAAKLAKDKKAEAEQKSKNDFEKDIAQLQKELKDNPQDIEKLKKEIANLETKKIYSETQLKEIEKKYSALGLKQSVIYPGSFFLGALAVGNLGLLISNNTSWRCIISLISIVLLIIGIKKIIFSLQTVSEVATNSDDYKTEDLKNALTNAIKTVESEKEPRPVIEFKEKPPFIIKTSDVVQIKFSIVLLEPGNVEAKNVNVWFLSSPEIEIVEDPTQGKPFKQDHDYTIPDANTIIYKYSDVKRHTKTTGILKIKAITPGNYKLRYKVDCDNHAEPTTSDREVGIIVQETVAGQAA